MPYLVINEDEMLPGRPVKTSLVTRLRNNPVSMVTGDDETAPKIQPSAFPVAGFAGYFLRGCAHEGYGQAVGESGTLVLVPDPQEFDADSGFRYAVHRNGTFATRLQLYINANSSHDGDAYAQIYRNGAPHGTLRTVHMENGIGATGTWIEGLTYAAGDIIELYARYEVTGFGSAADLVVAVRWGIASTVPYPHYLTKILTVA